MSAPPSEGGASRRYLPELLAPAGDWECARAAVANGADAIYFGLSKFNARIRANNFTETDLPKLMDYLHRGGARGYVAFNTLVFENEMGEALRELRAIIAAGVDGVLVQDVGICRVIRRLSPDLPIHASTQMTVTSRAGVEFARKLGCDRVVVARECSIKEMAGMANSKGQAPGRQEQTPSANHAPLLPLEAFVHGALCVAYSGQCLTSEALGGRSANRGECAQACRLPYDLICDGAVVPLGDRRYLLSPQDLAGLEVLPDLVSAGVTSLKIEGRLKSPEYVANITRIYREALDKLGRRKMEGSAWEKEPARQSGDSPERSSDEEETNRTQLSRYEMEMAFSRGLHTGWMRGTNHRSLVHGRFGKKRGVYLGEVREVRGEGVLIVLEGPLKPGDGVVFDAGAPEEKEEGGRVYEILKPKSTRGNGQIVELRFGRGDIAMNRVHAGDKLWKTSDPELERRLRRSFAGEGGHWAQPVEMELHGRAGTALTLIARDIQGHVTRLESKMALTHARNQPLGTERLREQLGRLGGTPFKLDELKNHISGDVLLPVSELNRMRREMARELETQRARPRRWTLLEQPNLAVEGAPASQPPPNKPPHLIVLVRNLAQLETALDCGVDTIYCDFEDPKKYRDAVASVRSRRSVSGSGGPEIFVAPPRIFKMGEEWTLKQTRSSEADGYLVRNYDHLDYFANDRRVGDFSFNVANGLAAEYFKCEYGLERLTASYDLNAMQLEALLRAAPPEWFEITIHQHMPMFHMEHCLFCAFLSKGTDYTNCGRPCDAHEVKLRDRVGAEHAVKADIGCRNTVFNAMAQTGAEHASRMQALGARHFRVEFLNETREQVEQTIGKYGLLLRGEITGAQIWRELKLLNQLGVTRGSTATNQTRI